MLEAKLRTRLNDYLSPLLNDYQKKITRRLEPKIFRDVIWGFHNYRPYEIAIIDLPLFQRLRNLFQTSLALFTYPCAVHSRFEHSLGVASVASRLLSAIEERSGGHLDLNPVMKLEVRLAALLHDLAHGPFSHSSEKFYERLTDEGFPIFSHNRISNRRITGRLNLERPELFAESSASELLTYLLLTTDAFKTFWKFVVGMYERDEPSLREVDPERMASMILGADLKIGSHGRFYREIVNGPFDADKLDYLPRDGYFTGLDLRVDIERLLHTLKVVTQDSVRTLGVVTSGSSVLEQVIFAKSQLFSSVYHHHKVRAAHQLLLQLLRTLSEGDSRPRGLDLNDPVSYTILDDYDLLGSAHAESKAETIVTTIKARRLPKRALVITYPCFADGESRENFNRLDEDDVKLIEAQVESELNLHPGDVMVDIPEPPRVFGTGQALVELAPGRTMLLQELYPAGAWAKAYVGYRRVAYIFTTSVDRRKVGLAAKDALRKLADPIKLNENALDLAKT